MFVNGVLSCYDDILSINLTFRMLQFITFSSENSQMTCPAAVKFWAAKATKIIRILCLLRNADTSKQFCLTYLRFGKKMTKECFSSHRVVFLTRYKLHLGLEPVSKVKTKSQKVWWQQGKTSKGDSPSWNRVKLLQKTIHCKKEACAFQSIDKFHCQKIYLYCTKGLGESDW